MMMMEGERADRVRWREVEKKDGPDNMDEERPQDGGRKKSKGCGRGQPLVVFTTTTQLFDFDSRFLGHTTSSNYTRDH